MIARGATGYRTLVRFRWALLLLLLLLLARGVAQAIPIDWVGTTQLSGTGEQVFESHVASGSGDVAAAVWLSSNAAGTTTSAWAATRVAGTWTPPRPLSSAVRVFADPNVAVSVDPLGTTVVVWIDEPATGDPVVRAATKDRDGAWSDPEDVSPPTRAAVYPRVVLDGTGTATVVYRRFPATVPASTVVVGQRRPRSGSWSAPEDLTTDAPASAVTHEGLDIAADVVGNVVVSAARTAGGGVMAIERPASGPWGQPIPLAGQPNGNRTLAVMDPQYGAAAVLWEVATATGTGVQAASRAGTGGNYATGPVSPNPLSLLDAGAGSIPRTTTAGDGVTFTALAGAPVTGELLWTSRGLVTGWGNPVPLDAGGSFHARVATNLDGLALAVWGHHDEDGLFFAVQDQPSQSFGAKASVPGPSAAAVVGDVSVNRAGSPALLWAEGTALWANGRGGGGGAGCGDGVVQAGETCDAGAVNGTAGACCSAVCTAVASGTACKTGTGCQVGACDACGTCRLGPQCSSVTWGGSDTPSPAGRALKVTVTLADTSGSGKAMVEVGGYVVTAPQARLSGGGTLLTKVVRRILSPTRRFKATVVLKLNGAGRKALKAVPKGGSLPLRLGCDVTDRTGAVTPFSRIVRVLRGKRK